MTLTQSTTRKKVILVLGSGTAIYREYILAAASRRYRLILMQADPPTWQRRYITDHAVVPMEEEAVTARARALARRHAIAGVLTYEEGTVPLAAAVAVDLGLPYSTPAAVARCRDKVAMRRALDRAGVPSARHAHATSVDGVWDAAAEIGYPVVLKPPGLAGSLGVVKVSTPAEVAEAYMTASDAYLPGFPKREGVLVEEYLGGPEFSADSVIFGGRAEVVTLARKQLGFAPYFEEVGHVVSGAEEVPQAAAIHDAVVCAQEALGVTFGVTHTELRLTARGPRIVEVNPRLGGDMIPWLGRLALGADLAAAAADVAVGVQPRVSASGGRAAAIRFFYPHTDMRFLGASVDSAPGRPWSVERVAWEPEPGDLLRLPPRGFLSRLGFAIVEGRHSTECLERLDELEARLRVSYEPLSPSPRWPHPGGDNGLVDNSTAPSTRPLRAEPLCGREP